MALAAEVARSARALDGASFALAHTLRHLDSNAPPAKTAIRQEAEAICISTQAVLDELVPINALLSPHATVVGNCIPGGARVRNGFDSLASILVTLLDNATAAVLDVAGTLARPTLTPTGAFERMVTHHGQLRAMYGIMHLSGKVVAHADVSRTLFVDVGSTPADADLDPMKWRAAIKMDDFYGRYFGFHYAPDMRNVLRVVNIARGSVDSVLQQDITAKAPALVKNVAMLGWGWIYSNIVIMNNLGFNINAASKIGTDKGVRPSLASVRAFMNLVEDPVISGVTGLASADTAIDRAFSIPAPEQFEDWRTLKLAMLAAADDMFETEGVDYKRLYEVFCSVKEPVTARLMSSNKRPANLQALQPSGTPNKVHKEEVNGTPVAQDDLQINFTNFSTPKKSIPGPAPASSAPLSVSLDAFTSDPHVGLGLAVDNNDGIQAAPKRESKSLNASPAARSCLTSTSEQPAPHSLHASPKADDQRASLGAKLNSAAESSYLASALKTEFSRIQTNVTTFLGLQQTPPASGLIVHFHGGGFLSQSSRGHSVYLKEWCADMADAVILSIDYKLAPEHQFPTALHECVYAYQWALAHSASLGTSADRVVFVGDSAGGNLALAAALLAGDIGLRRPDGVCLAYPSLYMSKAWSPSRLLSFFDPLLPLSVLELCMTSYLSEENQSRATEDPYISPVVASRDQLRQLPPVTCVCGELDPLLDDSAVFADRMKSAGRTKDVFRIYESMPHGFLNMIQVSQHARDASAFLSTQMADYLRIEFSRGNYKSTPPGPADQNGAAVASPGEPQSALSEAATL